MLLDFNFLFFFFRMYCCLTWNFLCLVGLNFLKYYVISRHNFLWIIELKRTIVKNNIYATRLPSTEFKSEYITAYWTSHFYKITSMRYLCFSNLEQCQLVLIVWHFQCVVIIDGVTTIKSKNMFDTNRSMKWTIIIPCRIQHKKMVLETFQTNIRSSCTWRLNPHALK